MSNVVKMRFHKTRVVRSAENHAQLDPPDAMVRDMCVYTRSMRDDGDMRCQGCPKWEDDPKYGKIQSMCYGMATS